jgi:TolB-like protein
MKRCLTCHRVYSDELLKFCRVDGGTLLNISTADAEAESASTLPLSARARVGSATHGLGDDGVAHETVPPTNVGTSKLKESSPGGVRARWRWLIILLAVFVVAGALALYIRSRNAIGPIESIAVVPLASENRDGEPDQPPVAVRSFTSENQLPVPAMPPPADSRGRRFTGNQKSRDEVLKVLAASLTDDVRNDLARLPDLRVIPGGDASPHTEKDARNVAIDEHKSGVHAVFSGRIEQYRGVLVISVKLVDERHKKLIWGRRYTDFTDEQLPAKRLEISQQLAECLRQNRQGKHCEN